MVAVPLPAAVTTPLVLTVATVVAELLHTPPVTASVSVVVVPAQIVVRPAIVPAEGALPTVMFCVA